MNAIPDELANAGFDFVWSSCAFEHLGSIERGQQFVQRAMQCLRPGGVAVHTTELNVTSNAATLSEGSTVLFRRVDLERLAEDLTCSGDSIELDFDFGKGAADHDVDVYPYRSEPHLTLRIGEYVSTSMGLIIRRGARWSKTAVLPSRPCLRRDGERTNMADI